jgi:hypothetical protein
MDEREEELRASRPAPVIPVIPAAYFEDGYLVLTLSARKGRVHFYSCREGGKSLDWEFPQFTARMRSPDPNIPINPYRLALNILARKRAGTLKIRARDERKILSILEANREELLKLTPEQLGTEYARIVGKAPPDPADKDSLVKELLMQVKEEVATAEQKEAEASAGEKKEGEPATGTSEASTTPTTEGENVKSKSKKKSGAKTSVAPSKEDLKRYAAAGKKDEKGKKAAAKKPAAKKPAAPAKKAEPKPKGKTPKVKKEGEGPYREGSKKSAAYAFFKKCGGDREKTVAHTISLGCTESTAKSWYAVFVRAG